MKTGQIKKAVDSFRQALSITEDKIYYFNLMVALSTLGDLEQLRTIAQKSLPIMKKHVLHNQDDIMWRVSYAYALHWANENEQSHDEIKLISNQVDLDGFTLYNLGALFD